MLSDKTEMEIYRDVNYYEIQLENFSFYWPGVDPE